MYGANYYGSTYYGQATSGPYLLSTTLSEVVSVGDVLVKTPQKTFLEAIALIESFIKLPSRIFSQVFKINDLFTGDKTGQTTLVETITIVDEAIRSLIKDAFTEVVTITDSVYKQGGKVLSEVISILDSFITTSVRIFTEVITVGDVFVKNILYQKIYSEVISIVDVFASVQEKILSEIITITDEVKKFLNGILITIWTRVARTTSGIWTRVSKNTNSIWTRRGRS